MKKLKFKKMKRATLQNWINFLELTITNSRAFGYDDSDECKLILATLGELLTKLNNVMDYYETEFNFSITIAMALAMKIHTLMPIEEMPTIDMITINSILAKCDQKTK